MSVVGIIRAFRRVFAPGRHTTGARSSARGRQGRSRWQQCPGCDVRVQLVHTCSFCAQCCPCRPARPGGGGDDSGPDDDGGASDGGRFRFSVQDS